MAATSPRTVLYVLSADGNFDAAYKGSQLANKEMEAPLALPVCLQSREGVVLNRPTQGWTVEEAGLLCKASIYSPTVQPWVGRSVCAMHLS